MMISSEFMRLSFWPLHTSRHSYDTNQLEFVSASGNCNQQWIKRTSSCGIRGGVRLVLVVESLSLMSKVEVLVSNDCC